MGTEHYQFKQWETWERPGRAGLNAALADVDSALAAAEAGVQTAVAAGVVVGQYTGDNESTRLISLGFTPRAVLVEAANGRRVPADSEGVRGGLAVTGASCTNGGAAVVQLVEDGFQVRCAIGKSESNYRGAAYRYLALR